MEWFDKKRKIKKLIEQLNDDGDFFTKFDAQEKLGKIGEPAVPFLIDALQEHNLRVGAGASLVEIGEASIEPLLIALKDPDWHVRFVAAHSLGRLGATQAVDDLIELLTSDPSPEVRQYAASALGELGDKRAVQPLKTQLQREDSMLPIRNIQEALERLQK